MRGARLGTLALALAGCAGVMSERRGHDDAARAGWRALEDGRPAEAARAFDARLAATPEDLLARFGRATLAYEHGDPGAALDDYAAVLGAASRGQGAPELRALLAPVAAARALALDDDVGPGRRARAEATLLGEGASLPWQARLELARLADRVARRAGDADALERETARRGCARAIFDAGTLGPLPHLDLDGTAAAPPAATWRPLIVSGCRVTVPARDGRPGAERFRAAVDVAAGAYDLVLDYDGDARVALDGGPSLRHGSETRVGPRVSAFALTLPAGRHDLEVRLATPGGRGELALVLLPRAAGAAARFVDPRGGRAGRGGTARGAAPPAEGSSGPTAGDDALADYARAFAANRVGDADLALTLAARLAGRRRFAPGLALAAVISRDDPTRPASFSRDTARALFRAALTADAGAARASQGLAAIELEDDRIREAIDDARAAARAAPRWWAPELVLAHALRARGLDVDADAALDRAAAEAGPEGDRPCLLVEALLRRADDRRDLVARAALEDSLVACDATSETRIERLRARGDLAGEEGALRRALGLAPERDELAEDLAQVLGAQGRRREALATLGALVAREPEDPFLRVRVADAQAAAGQASVARETARAALAMRPDAAEVRRVARALGVPLPLDAYRLDGRAVIRAFEASARRYAAPAVVVLDRSVERVFPDGAELTLTHEIVRVQSKDAIDRWAEVEVPAGAEVLTLRTHKPDGTTREPEEIAGKETVSAANVAIGDYIEWELLETKAPSGAFAPGFLADRFYFQSFDAPLDRTELVLVTPRATKLAFDARAGAPKPSLSPGAEDTIVTTFARTGVPQLFVERAAVPAVEYVPSVRASSALDFAAWTRYVAEQLAGTTRSSPALRERARQIAADAHATAGDRARLAAAVVSWVTESIEAEGDLRDGAAQTLARGSGNRLALILALLREVGVPARPILARSRLVAEAAAPTPAEELDDFADSIIEIDLAREGGRGTVFVDPRLRHAAFGYLPPSLDGARTLALDPGPAGARFGVAHSTGTADHRSVDVTIRLDEQGGGAAVATEELTGWPALEWAELVEKFGADRAKLRQDFEQRWLGVQFPGARLRDLDVTLPKDAPGAAARAVRVRYSFVSPQLAVRGDHEMRFLPTFFRSQPGRRFATEPQRSTTLMLGFDIPFHMTATVELPRAANLVELGAGTEERVERKGAYRFVEERRLRTGGGKPGSPANDVLVLTRESSLPLSRIEPADYAGVAADLRRVDGLEQREIRIRLRAARGRKMTAQALRAATLVAVAVGAAACAGPGTPSTGAADRLVVARPAEPINLDPARATDIESLEVAEQVYGRLVRFAPGRLEPEPDLATSWSVSDDGTVWTFELRPDVWFHDGTPVNADAVVFSFERQLLADHPSHEADFAWTRSFHNIRRVRAVTPLRVQFDIDRPYAPFLANLATGPAAIVSPTAVRKLGSRFGRHPVGAGPYRFVEWIPGDRITLERNPTYWDHAARTRYLVLLVMPDSRQRLQALESGAADIIQQLAPDDLPLVRLHPDLRLAMAPAALVSYLAMNTQKRPLDDPRIRRAIATAIRRDALVKLVYQGVGIPAIGPLPPNVWGARTDVVTYPYDPERARAMLAEAGWRPDHAAPLKLYAAVAATPFNPAPARIAAIIKTCLADVGIPVEIILSEPAEHQRALWAGEHDLALHGWFNDNGDPDNFLYTLLDSDNTTGSRPSNVAFYSNAWFDDLIGVAQRTTDRTERERLYSQAQAILATDVPWVPLAHSNVVFATRANIRGLVVQPSAMGLYRGVERAP